MERIAEIMMNLIANDVCDKTIDFENIHLSDDDLKQLYTLSKKHDLAHLVGNALISHKLLPEGEIMAKYEKLMIAAVYRYERMNYELNSLKTILNQSEIPFIPLKGSVLRQYYPEPWMRTSCDIDILVHDAQVDEAAQLIVDKLGFTYQKKNYHDISMMSDNKIHLELHHNIKENNENIDALLADCWNYAFVHREYEYSFTPEFFLFHQFAHALYHFLGGGCGIRPFLDIYLLERNLSYDRDTLAEMLSKTGIKKFSEVMSRLADAWFGNGKYDDLTRHMEEFIMSGGVYGTTENSLAVSQQKEKGRIGYILHRIWLPYELLCTIYPRLYKRRYLQLFYEAKRWLRIFNPEVRNRKNRDLRAIKQLSAEKKDNVNRMLSELGLM